MNIVLGLGNPGPRYAATRHNLGFRAVERLAARLGARFVDRVDGGLGAWTAEARVAGRRVVIAKPAMFMNRSGEAAEALRMRFGADVAEMVVVFDDADLALGRVRVRCGGGAGGHNGMRSILEALGDDAFLRVRLGIRGSDRPAGPDLAAWVLAPFRPDEAETAGRLAALGAEATESALRDGPEIAMNRFNGRTAAAPRDGLGASG